MKQKASVYIYLKAYMGCHGDKCLNHMWAGFIELEKALYRSISSNTFIVPLKIPMDQKFLITTTTKALLFKHYRRDELRKYLD